MKALFLTQSYWGEAKTALCFNWPSWFLSSLCLCYLLAPILNLLCRRMRRYAIYGIMLVCGGLIFLGTFWYYDAAVNGAGYYYMYLCPWIRLLDFIAGILMAYVYQVYENRDARCNVRGYSRFEALIFLIVILSLKSQAFIPEIYRWSVMWLPISLGMVWSFACLRGRFTVYLSGLAWLRWLGSRSFELYIVHRMILVFFARHGHPGWTYLLTVLATIIVAEIAHGWQGNLREKVQR